MKKYQLTKKRKAITIVEVMIAMIVFSFSVMLIFTLPRSIVSYAKEVDVKMDLYQCAVNEAEKLVAANAGSDKTIQMFLNGSTYTGKIDLISTNQIQRIMVLKDSSGLSTIESTNITMNYASVTFIDEKNQFSISFNVIPKQ